MAEARKAKKVEKKSARVKKTRTADRLRVAVLGAGHGGLATAGHLALMGHEVALFSFFKGELEPVSERGGVKLEGDVSGFGELARVTSNIDEAVRRADLIMVIMPALAHKNVTSLLAGCLEDGQVLLLSPARTGGAFEVYDTLRRHQVKKRVVLAECQTFLYATESRGPAHVEIMKVKNKVRASALPASDNGAFLELMGTVYRQYAHATNVLETSINNTGAVVHPAPMLLNSGLLEKAAKGEDLRYYAHIITKWICDNVLEKIDREKSDVARSFGVPVLDIRGWYEECYGVTGDTIYDVLQANRYYDGFSAPKHVLGYHHVLDEVPNSLVGIAALASVVGVPTTMTDAIVDLACASLAYDFRAEGRTLVRLGLAGMTRDEIVHFANNGRRFWEY